MKEPKLEDFYNSLESQEPTELEYNNFINEYNNWKLKTKNEVNINDITRVEVIDQNGRLYVKYFEKGKLQLSLQNEGRTLKLFIN